MEWHGKSAIRPIMSAGQRWPDTVQLLACPPRLRRSSFSRQNSHGSDAADSARTDLGTDTRCSRDLALSPLGLHYDRRVHLPFVIGMVLFHVQLDRRVCSSRAPRTAAV
jgi:hypothetical protein